MIPDPILLKAMVIALKATLIFQAALVFYFFGKDQKIPYSARNIFFILANSGCLFLAGGLALTFYYNCLCYQLYSFKKNKFEIKKAQKIFGYSIFYLFLVFVLFLVDRLI